jgi:hypothetical protein
MDTDHKIPKYTYDLLRQLQAEYPDVSLPLTEKGWGHMDEAAIRQMAFYHGQKALIDMLLQWERESNEVDDGDDNREAGLEPGEDVYARILADDGEYKEMASIPVARATIGSVLDIDTDE